MDARGKSALREEKPRDLNPWASLCERSEVMADPWNNWFHCCGSTYGAWLRGDPRGWRARHHREHVDGDYKNPPPKGKYDRLYEYSKKLMKRERVELTPEQREHACRLMAEALQFHHVELIDLCVGKKH